MKRVVIANFYPVWPAMGGGQRRIYFLARELSKVFDVEIVAPERSGASHTTHFTHSFRETCVAVESQFRALEVKIDSEVNMAADLAYTKYWHECQLYQEMLRKRLANADFAISAHPYSIAALKQAMGLRKIPLVFDSQNVEQRAKFQILKDFPNYLADICDMERMALEDSDLVLACSRADAQAFSEIYGIDPGRIEIVENGVDAVGVPHLPPETLVQLRSRLGINWNLVAVFGGSFHHPNFLAAQRIMQMAERLPNILFLFLGSVCEFPALKECTAANVRCIGQVDEGTKWMAFAAADIGLNPMELGSGTNIKMFEYAAAGLPALSNEFGARGIPLVPGTDFLLSEIEAMPEVLEKLTSQDRPFLEAIGLSGRRRVTAVADWSVIGERYRAALYALEERTAR